MEKNIRDYIEDNFFVEVNNELQADYFILMMGKHNVFWSSDKNKRARSIPLDFPYWLFSSPHFRVGLSYNSIEKAKALGLDQWFNNLSFETFKLLIEDYDNNLNKHKKICFAFHGNLDKRERKYDKIKRYLDKVNYTGYHSFFKSSYLEIDSDLKTYKSISYLYNVTMLHSFKEFKEWFKNLYVLDERKS